MSQEGSPAVLPYSGEALNRSVRESSSIRQEIVAFTSGTDDIWFLQPGWRVSGSLRIRRHFPVTVEAGSIGHIVSDNRFLIYGEGLDYPSALEDYMLALSEYYELAAEASKKGAPEDREHFARLSEYIEPIVVQELLVA